MRDLIEQLELGHDLTPEGIGHAVDALIDPGADQAAKAGFLRALRSKGETAEEMAGFAEALLGHAVDPQLSPAELHGPLLDVCGTGGDRMELFNVSTTSMFVLAAGGAVVVKHGNRAITSKCGGADVLEALGVDIELPPVDLSRCVRELGLGFLFAPAYHPAFKAIAPVRKQLAAEGTATIFNLLGPLLNPARPARQLVGVFSREALPKYARALQSLCRTRAWAVHGSGLDEVSLTDPSDVVEVHQDSVSEFLLHPADLGLSGATLEDLRGGDRAENAALLVGILDGSVAGPKREMVALNAAAGFVVAGIAPDLRSGYALALEQIDSGRSLSKLRTLQAFRRS